MALNLSKTSLLRIASVRSYGICPSAGVEGTPVGGTFNYDVKTTVLPNKLIVAAADNGSPISRVSIVFKAGSRNETSENVGVTHVLRIAAGLTTRHSSQFSIIRHIQEYGSRLTCTTDREVVTYTLEGTREAVENSIPFLTEVATQQIFRPWELDEITPRLRLELATRPPQLRAVDLLHKAAFRYGLGNSLYIPKYNLGKISTETLQHYVSNNFTSIRTAVVGLGVDYSNLVKYAENLELQSGVGPVNPANFNSGEIRSDKGGDLAYVAIAGKGASLRDSNQALVYGILQYAYGVGPSVKRGRESSGILSKAVGTNISDPHLLSALNINYSDAGLFGVLVASCASSAGKVVESAVKTLKSGVVSKEDVERGKKQLKYALWSSLENGTNAIESIATQALFLGSVRNPEQLYSAIDDISTTDVQNAAKEVASSKFSIAGVGNLSCVPFADKLNL